ncbi:OPT oligopeptide transporter protein-domain-containing protein [Talaromyces proteolyticus]|uniref:OPT oligopeptide transporter protein-domain-containing protein n=1 Tax=Talaromyces proteolyticus TaxID=1131652 RepID=A0AAD4KLT4_9EURO|nr:OPT oligopeptide transporter protein-domain-containing protein [Talaromyces proteolyticus]KAH8694011.1 OPT oligopeptide transporter protein-domain-containing protein [Talaromyces proteolyticus]
MQVRGTVDNVLQVHVNDPNFPSAILNKFAEFKRTRDVDTSDKPTLTLLSGQVYLLVALILTNSPYPEVRAIVSNDDDPQIPCSTIRSWAIGLFFVVGASVVNQLFSIRQPPIGVDVMAIQLLSYPLGKAAERFLPDVGFTFRSVRHSFNPGRFSQKEHLLITIMANVGTNRPYSNFIVWTQVLPKYFNQPYARTFGYQLLLSLSSDMMGYGLAGLCRKFLTYPSFCLFPQSLVTLALTNTLHHQENSTVTGPFRRIYKLSRFRYFVFAFVGMFCYAWLPGYLFGALSIFNWLSWISPRNVNLVAITGILTGMGLSPLPTLDWNMVTTVVDPLVVPLISTLNIFGGVIISGALIMIFWYTNTYWASYLPINTNRLFNRWGKAYNISEILDSHAVLEQAKYQQYSPAFLAPSSIVQYSFFFATYSALITYTILYQGQAIRMGFRNLIQKNGRKAASAHDVHSMLMCRYKEVSEIWYTALNVVALGLALGVIRGWPTYTNVGIAFMAFIIAAVFLIPLGLIYAMTGISINLNVLSEFLGGLWTPGNALSVNFFKLYGYTTISNALPFISDLKLAHYAKIPPWHTFWAQVVATIVSAVVCTSVLNYQIDGIPDVCESTQKDRFTCPGVNTYFTASVIFGSIGPRRMFGAGGPYTALLAAFPIGLMLPVLLYFAQGQVSWLRHIHPVMLLHGGATWSPFNFAYIWPAVPISMLSMAYLKKRYLAFWAKYNYITSAAFSSAIAIASLLIYFILQSNGIELSWWGNDADSGCEAHACARHILTGDEYFGPREGEWT